MRLDSTNPTNQLKRQTRQRKQLKVAVDDLARKLAPLGMNFAGVFVDPELQDLDRGDLTLGFAGNVSLEAGSLLMKTFLALQKDKNATRTDLSVADSSPAAPAESKAIEAEIEILASTYIPENVTN
jgi:hypothetical protein